MTAAQHWRVQLEEWALPEHLLAQAEESPYGWQKAPWKLRAEKALQGSELSPTTRLVHDLAGPSGSVLDIGAGSGRASLPLVALGHPVTAVEPDPTMLESLTELSEGMPLELVKGRWPEVVDEVAIHAVVMSAHVVYDVTELAGFLAAMDRRARTAVVIEMFSEHPWSALRELYLEFHQIDRPTGPTWSDLVAVVREMGREPQIERWDQVSDVFYESLPDAVAATARRLVLPRTRWPQLEEYLAKRVIGEPGRLHFPPLRREVLAVWWHTRPRPASAFDNSG